jgi:predicted ATPase
MQRSVEGTTPEEMLPDIEELISNLADSDVAAEKWTRELARASVDQLRDLVLIDKRTNTPVSHRDIGIGISQVLPVLVSAYASAEKILAIEQPEIHLHLALQAELGDVFIESALGGRQNTFILETHSEHLILRIMRRMRDTVHGVLPNGLPPVRPADVAILYVQPRDSAAVVRLLELDEEGQLLDPWPGGFFEEGFRERFA